MLITRYYDICPIWPTINFDPGPRLLKLKHVVSYTLNTGPTEVQVEHLFDLLTISPCLTAQSLTQNNSYYSSDSTIKLTIQNNRNCLYLNFNLVHSHLLFQHRKWKRKLNKSKAPCFVTIIQKEYINTQSTSILGKQMNAWQH